MMIRGVVIAICDAQLPAPHPSSFRLVRTNSLPSVGPVGSIEILIWLKGTGHSNPEPIRTRYQACRTVPTH